MTQPLPPSDAERLSEQRALWMHGTQLLQAGRWADATVCFLRIVETAPGDVAAMLQASYLLLRQDRYRHARALALSAADAVCRPSPEATVEIAKLLRRFEESERLQRLSAATDWRPCTSARLLTEMARLLMNSGLHEEALALATQAVAADPDYPHGHYMRGSILAAAGRQDAARDALQQTLTLDPGAPHAHWMLSWQTTGATTDGADSIARLRELVRQSPPASEARAYLGYALHNRLHQARQWDESWEALDVAMQAKRLVTPWRAEAQRQLFDSLRTTPVPSLRAALPMDGDPVPIFIVGMHRSGTTLLERLLAGHSSVTDGGESYAFTAALCLGADHYCAQVIDAEVLARADEIDWEIVGSRFRESGRWRARGRAALTEKLPPNFLVLGLIARALPEARFLHMQRDPVDTCFSNLRTFFGQAAAYSYDQDELAGYYLQYRELMAHWRTQLPDRLLDIDYSSLVEDPATQMRRVMEFCGLDFEPGALEAERSGGSVATASLADVRQGIRKDRGGAWKPYADHLQPLLRALRPADANLSERSIAETQLRP